MVAIWAEISPIGHRVASLDISPLVLSFGDQSKPRDQLKVSSVSGYSVAPGVQGGALWVVDLILWRSWEIIFTAEEK